MNSFNSTYPSGYFQFTPDITSLPGIIDTGDPFASFLLGLPASAERTIITAPSYFRNSYQGFTARDRYAARKNLTLASLSPSAAGRPGRRNTIAKALWILT